MNLAEWEALSFEEREIIASDPQIFEENRLALIEEYISSAAVNKQDMLREAQKSVDEAVMSTDDPLERAALATQLLTKHAFSEGGALDRTNVALQSVQNTARGYIDSLESSQTTKK